MTDSCHLDRYLPPGTKVRFDGLHDPEGPEYGIVVHGWLEDTIGYDCYVAFFGTSIPTGQPEEPPYVLRYAATSLVVIEP